MRLLWVFYFFLVSLLMYLYRMRKMDSNLTSSSIYSCTTSRKLISPPDRMDPRLEGWGCAPPLWVGSLLIFCMPYSPWVRWNGRCSFGDLGRTQSKTTGVTKGRTSLSSTRVTGVQRHVVGPNPHPDWHCKIGCTSLRRCWPQQVSRWWRYCWVLGSLCDHWTLVCFFLTSTPPHWSHSTWRQIYVKIHTKAPFLVQKSNIDTFLVYM